jgi:hypothetical protein
MTRDDYLEIILEACAFVNWEVYGIYKHYQIVAITNGFVQISIISYSQEESYGEVVDFDNTEDLIDDMLDYL